MAIPQPWLDQLRERISLSGLIGGDVRLKRAGAEHKACCPFHHEKTPSFTVNDAKGFYHCFGCGAHGDAISWLTDQRGMSFMDAVKELAEQAGMDLPEQDPKEARRAEVRATLGEVLAETQDWFVGNLKGSDATRSYLTRRGFDPVTIARFGFGYAPDDRNALLRHFGGLPEAMLIDAGLRACPDGAAPYDRFRGRLMLPIHDARGRIVGFGGRILVDRPGAPKYLNSPDTPLFDKGRTLYNLHRAMPAARKSGRLAVVEGYMDVIALAAAGIEECVAPMGTALTETQIGLLWSLSDEPVLCFDGDNAGQRAVMRAIERALPVLQPGKSLRIARLPAGKDPDDLVREKGKDAMIAVLAGAKSLLDALWDHERDAEPLTSPERKAALKARLLAHVDAIGHGDIKALYRRALLERYSAFAFPKRGEAARKPGMLEPPRSASPDGARAILSAAVIAGLVRHPGQVARHSEALASCGRIDHRFDLLLDGDPVEPPAPSEYAGMPFGFLRPDADPSRVGQELAQAIDLLVRRPGIDAALVDATRRLETDLSDEAFAEQQRLLAIKRDFDNRVRRLFPT